ncbi:uncharacterized protein LOC105384034 isoform X1 [Plutella xylostella]|uniref:uncharacterized protein LOC105384034 isoform X1 n=1 Tax=Plutella xylostella TaxID=51655 RepID=UPI0020328F86|nr:uncharacterized protein LOC105384034 isoform X1 [Plutella xylostella]
MDEEETFDLNTIHEYELQSNEDGSVKLHENCLIISHNETKEVKYLPLTEEVLQALGLALLQDEEDTEQQPQAEQPEDTQLTEATETYEESVRPEGVEITIEEMPLKPEEGTITIVFTDDEDAMELDRTITDSEKNNGGVSDKDNLFWSVPMTHRLLDLYEEKMHLFHSPDKKQRSVWKEIYEAMSQEYPEILHSNEFGLRSKFGGLKRTYKGAVEYLNDNLHTTKWPFFERMEKIMNTRRRLENGGSKAEGRKSGSGASDGQPWERSWTPLLLQVYEECMQSDAALDWSDIRARLAQAEPGLARVSTRQIKQKFLYLMRSYAAMVKTGSLPRGELLDLQIFESLQRIYSAEEQTIEQQEQAARSGTRGGKLDAVHMQKPGAREKAWPKAHTELLLDLYTEHRPRLQHEPASAVYQDIATSLRATLPGSGAIDGPACEAKIAALMNRLNVCKAKETKNWQYYSRAQRAFGGGGDGWSAPRTKLLLELYELTSRTLDESGPRFWRTLAERMAERVPDAGLSAAKCEAKMQSLLIKYKSLAMRKHDHNWVFFPQMDKIFGTKSTPWPNRTLQLLLAMYQANIHRLEAGEAPARVWAAVSQSINNAIHQEDIVTPKSCSQKMSELKQKYNKLMRDDEAAKAWPLFRRMSELFSTYLWSKANVDLLLDVYERHKHRFDLVHDQAAVWDAISDEFNDESHSSAVIGQQCQTEMHVLKARYRALLKNDVKNSSWPFFEKMHRIFGEDADSPAAARGRDASKSLLIPLDLNFEDDMEEYTWTEESTDLMLQLYQKHRHWFGNKPRSEVWAAIDRELTEHDPTYTNKKKGYGGWFRYLDIMTKYMDIKERRSDEKDWPYYERMESIFSSRGRSGSVPSDVSEVASDRSEAVGDLLQAARGRKRLVDAPDINSDHLPDLSIDEPTSTKKNKTGKTNNTSLNHADTPLSCGKKQKPEPLPTSEDFTLTLLESYDKHRRRGALGWRTVLAILRNKFPQATQVTQARCEERLAEVKDAYMRMKIRGPKSIHDLKLPARVFEKMEELNIKKEAPEAETEENGDVAADDDVNHSDEVSVALLREMKRKNDINEKRLEVSQRMMEMKKRQHEEKIEMLKKIHEALSTAIGHENKELIDSLERTLEDIHAS